MSIDGYDHVLGYDESVGQNVSPDDQVALYRETNARFWARTGHKRGQKLDMFSPRDRAMSKTWLRIYDEVRGHRARAAALARKVYGETFTPYILVIEARDGSMTHLPFQRRSYLDAKYTWVVDQDAMYKYVAMFDFTEKPRGPLYDQFSTAASRPLAALAAFRQQAENIARRSHAPFIGTARQASTGQWHTPTFATREEAAEWLKGVAAHPTWFTYAAYFDKSSSAWPLPVSEEIGHAPSPTVAAW